MRSLEQTSVVAISIDLNILQSWEERPKNFPILGDFWNIFNDHWVFMDKALDDHWVREVPNELSVRNLVLHLRATCYFGIWMLLFNHNNGFRFN